MSEIREGRTFAGTALLSVATVFFAFLAFLVWTLVASVLLWQAPASASPPAAQT